ncbi:MAG: hypothetical protein PHT40_00225 [Patescibacteria group bacterium]|nr:hypothetical protein [Patescibacteria group bacterium]
MKRVFCLIGVIFTLLVPHSYPQNQPKDTAITFEFNGSLLALNPAEEDSMVVFVKKNYDLVAPHFVFLGAEKKTGNIIHVATDSIPLTESCKTIAQGLLRIIETEPEPKIKFFEKLLSEMTNPTLAKAYVDGLKKRCLIR